MKVSEQWKVQSNEPNLFKMDNKDTERCHLYC